jgi:molybdopterin/thiamine biosynthesis adenylyltransferase
MQTELRFTEAQWDLLQSHLLQDDSEHAALLLCGTHDSSTGSLLLVRRVLLLREDDLEADSGEFHLKIRPTTLARVAKLARTQAGSVVLCHSHPFPGPVLPSSLDLETERDLCGRVLVKRLHPRPVGALIVGPGGVNGRVWSHSGVRDLNRVRILGSEIADLTVLPLSSSLGGAVDRQVRAWGKGAQELLSNARIAIVGLGGTGSHVATQLAHLHVGELMLIDPDVVDESNLSRLIGSRRSDIGTPKVEVLKRVVRQINPSIRASAFQESVLDMDVQALAWADSIVCCTDGHGSRALLTELSFQYMVPIVDMGVEVQPETQPPRAGGGVRVIRPGEWCLHCAQTIDYHHVRLEYLSPDERDVERERGYLRGFDEPAPSVVSLNGVVASLAVLELCHLFTGFLAGGRGRLLYRAEARSLTTAGVKRDPDCYVCGPEGVLGAGDSRDLPFRRKACSA